jgi:NAD-dependent deacetylase
MMLAAAAAEDCDVFLSVGTSSLVYPAAGLAQAAAARGAVVIEVNPDATDLTPQVPFALQGPAGRILPDLCAAMGPRVAR